MKGFDVLHIKPAIKARNKIDLSCVHLTTADFGQINCLKAIETVPGDEIPVQGNYFCRTAPLVKPTFGKFSFKVVNAYVPYHQVAFDADAWIDGKTSFEGITPTHRYLTVEALFSFVSNYCCTSVGATSVNSQLTFIQADGTPAYLLFTNQGRYWVKVLNQLGYALPQGVDLQTGSVWLTKVASKHLSAYPLLSFFKLYNDYLSQSQRYNTSALSAALQAVKYGKSYTGYSPSIGYLNSAFVKILFDNLLLNYENDYFTSAWQEPNSPLYSPESVGALSVPGSSVAMVGSTREDSTLQTANLVSGESTVTQRGLDFLRAFDDWVRRNNFSGSRAVQQVYSRFGIKTDDYRTHYAEVFSTDTMPVQVGDVTATADSTGVPLGDYAGKAIMNGGKGFVCKASDYGIVLILGFFTVSPMNAYGFDRSVLRSEPLDYYTPEFDGLGADAISVGELYASPIGTGTTLDTDVFGFTERYNSYRYGRDQITGDFRDFHANGDMNTWHSGRNLEAVRAAGSLVAQSSAVNTMPGYDSEFNRIFSVTSGDVDHFYLTCQFQIPAIRPMLNLNQSVRLGEGDTTVPRNGNTIS